MMWNSSKLNTIYLISKRGRKVKEEEHILKFKAGSLNE